MMIPHSIYFRPPARLHALAEPKKARIAAYRLELREGRLTWTNPAGAHETLYKLDDAPELRKLIFHVVHGGSDTPLRFNGLPFTQNHAFEIVLALYTDKIKKYVGRMGVRQADLEDVVQNTFMNLFRYPSYKSDEQFEQYLFAIARNTALKYWRSKQKDHVDPLWPERYADPSAVQPSEKACMDELENELRNFLATINWQQFVHDCIATLEYPHQPTLLVANTRPTIEEGARQLGLSRGNYKMRVFRARNKLKPLLDTRLTQTLLAGEHSQVFMKLVRDFVEIAWKSPTGILGAFSSSEIVRQFLFEKSTND